MARQVYDPEDLKKAEERPYRSKGLPTSTSYGNVKFNTGKPKTERPGELSTSTSPGDVSYDSSGDIPEAESSLYNSSATMPGRFRFGNYIRAHPRRSAAGGGAVATIVGIIMFFSLTAGPFEFIHIAQLLERFHFAGLQQQQDDRFAKEVRFWRYSAKGEVEKTRLSYLGNKFGADRFETRLNSSGLQSSYSKFFGLFDGYVIDETNEKFKGMSRDEIKQYVKDNYGVDAVEGSTIKGTDPSIRNKLVVRADNLSYLETYKMTYGMLREAGYSKLSSAIGARYLCQRALCTSMLHPLSKKVSSGKRSIEDWWNKRTIADKEGSNTPELGTQDDPNAQKDPAKKGSADSVKAEVESDKSLSAKEISAKLTGGAAAVAGVLCIAKGVAADAHNLKASQIQVLMRMSIEAMGLGSQMQSGQDVNLDQLAKYSELLNGMDSTGKTSSWDESESIQANLGNPNTGIAPSKTLNGVTNDSTPFDFLNTSQPLATILGGVCSTVGQIITFLGGGIEGLVQTAVLSVILSQTSFASDLAHWLAGSAVDVDAVGADFGNEIDFGAALAANGQSVLAGATALDNAQAAAIQSTVNKIAQEQFDRQSLAHRLFSPYDQQSLISKVIDSSSPSPTQNIAKMGAAILNVKSMFSNMASIFSGSAKAATGTGFDYGFPTYGFSQSDMTNPAYENPYENICHIFGCSSEVSNNSKPITGFITGSTDASQPATPGGQLLLDRVKTCFGAQISQVQGQTDSGVQTQWNVTSSGDELPNPYDDKYPSYCKNPPEKELVDDWTRLRFFVMDTEVMNGMSCYEGDDQACTDINFNTQSQGTPISGADTTSQSSLSSQQLAQQILNNGNIDLSCYSSSVLQDVQSAAAGQPGTAGAMTSSVILQTIATVGNDHKVCVTAIQSNGQGHCNNTPKSGCPSDPHYNGDAVDFGNLDGAAVTGRNAPSLTIINLTMNTLPSGSRYGQVQCGPTPTLPAGITSFSGDPCTHLHVDVPSGTP